MNNKFFIIFLASTLFSLIFNPKSFSQTADNKAILIENVRVFDGKSVLSGKFNVFIQKGVIHKISSELINPEGDFKRINGKDKTLIPGLIDAHAHLVLEAFTVSEILSDEFDQELKLEKAGELASKILMTGFTSIRDMGGPVCSVKKAIDAEEIDGPRIWPSGAFITQTSGHGDFRLPEEKSRRFFGKASEAEEKGVSYIADGRDEVLTAVRENLRDGASQIKVMAGGGTSSAFDPLDVTQYTLDEMKAAVEAASDWGTYVTVHGYTPKAVQRAVEAGVKSIEHGQLLDEETLKILADKDVWLSSQILMDNTPDMDPQRIEKRAPLLEAQKEMWPTAKKIGVKLAWGTDFLFNPSLYKQRGKYALKLQSWFSNAEILRMLTFENAELLSLSGLRSPYKGKLGVIEEGALADVLLINGNPIENLSLIADPDKNLLLIIKNGKIFKDLIN